MDRLLGTAPPRSYLISSTEIPDFTRNVSVGGDDMLINAINQLNRTNRRYVFLDQARISDLGQLELETTRKEDELKPQLYIRGSISQRDARVSDTEAGADWDRDTTPTSGLTGLRFDGYRTLTVISVDMHLVQYPSRRVLPGASVANAMVVVAKGFRGEATGLIDMTGLDLPLQIDRVESEGQAVRSLIELGIIELLGKHSGVPYWTCLEDPATNARATEARHREHVWRLDRSEIRTAQTMLINLGYLTGTPTGQLDASTRRAISTFQAEENLLPNGVVDFDLMERLRERSAQTRTSPQTATVPAPPLPAPRSDSAPSSGPDCVKNRTCDDIYLNLFDYLKRELT